MRMVRRHRVRSAVLAAGIAAGVVGAGVLPAVAASAAGKTVQIGNNTEVTVAKGWSVHKGSTGQLALSLNKPHAVIQISVFPGATGTVQSNGKANFNDFVTGFGLTHVQVTGKQSAQIPGNGKFDQAQSFTYTGKYQGQLLGGLFIEYQNSTSSDGAFAVSIAEQKDKSKLKKSISQMLESIATNP